MRLVDCTALRKAKPEDEPFLIALYASIREAELARASWAQAQKRRSCGGSLPCKERITARTFLHPGSGPPEPR